MQSFNDTRGIRREFTFNGNIVVATANPKSVSLDMYRKGYWIMDQRINLPHNTPFRMVIDTLHCLKDIDIAMIFQQYLEGER